ncbi:MAG: hypothetical protein AAFW84_02810, partial [Cyanobacteria bacterium J06635_15]
MLGASDWMLLGVENAITTKQFLKATGWYSRSTQSFGRYGEPDCLCAEHPSDTRCIKQSGQR